MGSFITLILGLFGVQIGQEVTATVVDSFFKAVTALLMAFGLAGCAPEGSGQNGAMTIQDTITMTRGLVDVMKEARVSGTVSISYDGDGEAYVKNSVGLDTGINMQASIQADFTEGKAQPNE